VHCWRFAVGSVIFDCHHGLVAAIDGDDLQLTVTRPALEAMPWWHFQIDLVGHLNSLGWPVIRPTRQLLIIDLFLLIASGTPRMPQLKVPVSMRTVSESTWTL
jgi:hypothetical protein